ncbi:glycoside hydrolase family 18 protein [Dyella sp. A6]|uniref:glycoside hydrolase family 18 protein n=1 Tax=Dyella aluminiiresistens TaxID=3069105 RepID=UPI002E79B08C|nr:glycoside hydrolase family 18 protein [Dyella sp. A6]
MRRLPTLLCATLCIGLFAAAATAATPYRIIGYITHRDPAQDQDIGKINTLIFATTRIVDGRVSLDPAGAARLQKVIALKANHPQLKVEISVGGWTVGGFSEAASTPASRRIFADSAAQLVADQHADGLDVDWEYPGHHESGIHSSPHDRANFTLLLKAIRTSLDRVGAAHGRTGANHYTLSIAAADGPFVSGIDIHAVARYLDWFNLMTYDFVNAMTPTTGHHTGLYASKYAPADARTTRRAVRQFLAAGVPPRKLVIGVAFYGREFADVNPLHHGLYQPYGHFAGTHAWPQLLTDYINKNGYVRYWDARAKAPWLWNAKTHSFISYDDPRSIAAKAAFVKARHLGGIMYWEQSLDPSDTLLDAIWHDLH